MALDAAFDKLHDTMAKRVREATELYEAMRTTMDSDGKCADTPLEDIVAQNKAALQLLPANEQNSAAGRDAKEILRMAETAFDHMLSLLGGTAVCSDEDSVVDKPVYHRSNGERSIEGHLAHWRVTSAKAGVGIAKRKAKKAALVERMAAGRRRAAEARAGAGAGTSALPCALPLTDTSLMALRVPQLKEVCAWAGLVYKGTKADNAKRLLSLQAGGTLPST